MEKTVSEALIYFLNEYPDLVTEGYVLDSTVEVVVNRRIFRIEILQCLHSGTFDVRALEQKKQSWEHFNIGRCGLESASKTLMLAMGFLTDALRPKSTSSEAD